MKTVHSISSSEDDTSDEENFSSVRQWCKIDSSSPAHSRFSFTGDMGTKACVTNISDPLEYFELFFIDEIYSYAWHLQAGRATFGVQNHIANKDEVSTYMSVQTPSGGYNSNSLGNS
ncbi:piggyBac transposable element-derived protein 4 [Trichonephila clavipes]|nr:piggyBac transposable element-derived protein 4 [Trichonephila clavipes]